VHLTECIPEPAVTKLLQIRAGQEAAEPPSPMLFEAGGETQIVVRGTPAQGPSRAARGPNDDDECGVRFPTLEITPSLQ
jgi:hypothetical protein